MLNVSFTLQLPSLAAVAAFVQTLDPLVPVMDFSIRCDARPSLGVIAYADRPDVGAEPVSPAGGSPSEPIVEVLTPTVTVADAAAVFGGAAAPVVPTPPAPSTAVAAASPTAPAATPVATSPATTPSVPVPPAPPAVPAAPAPTAPAASPSPAGVVLDSKGMPWDTRIHAESRATIADGSWRRKRNTPDSLVVQVEAELRQALAAGLPPAAHAAPPPNGAVPPAPPAPPAVAAAPAAMTAGDLMARLAPYLEKNQISNLTVASVLGQFQLANLWQIMARPDLVEPIAKAFEAEIAKIPAAA